MEDVDRYKQKVHRYGAVVDSKIASLISSGLDIVAGIALCFVPGMQGLGASLIGSGTLGIAGGYISEALGGSFELGAAIGSIIGSFIGGKVYQGIQGLPATKTASESVTEVGNYLLRDAEGKVRYTGIGDRSRMLLHNLFLEKVSMKSTG
ncbi:MAG: hypothetical protein J6C62_07650 [Clostridia bacterium]|nr:hypothetical protein [Clostridia bacterium]